MSDLLPVCLGLGFSTNGRCVAHTIFSAAQFFHLNFCGITLELSENCQYSWISASLEVHQSVPHPPGHLCLCWHQLLPLQALPHLDRHQVPRHEYHHHHQQHCLKPLLRGLMYLFQRELYLVLHRSHSIAVAVVVAWWIFSFLVLWIVLYSNIVIIWLN